ncbi:hypothetical protein [Bartonella sp. B17]
MVDFIRILKTAINAQSDGTSQTRQRIYTRAIETLEHQFVAAAIPQEMVDKQRQILQNAITAIEEEYLAIEKETLFSSIGWKPIDATKSDESTRNSVLLQRNDVSVVMTEKKQEISNSSSKENKIFYESSAANIPDAEPINMDTHLRSKHVNKNMLQDSTLASALQADNSHVVSHIFSQALRRANRSSIQKRIIIGVTIFASFSILIIGICFIGGRVFVSNDHQLLKKNIQASNALPKAFLINKKLTQRLLEDGSEVDVGADQMANPSNEEGIATGTTTNLQEAGQLGEAVFYQARTSYDAEKIAIGSARWSLIKDAGVKDAPEKVAIQGDITIPDEGLSLRLILRRNTDLSFPAAYIMDVIFILSDKFSGQAISSVQALTFKASEQSIGQSLKRTTIARIDDNFFLVALSGNHLFLNQNLQMMRELDWIRLILTDKNGRVNELTFAKGPIGEAIFNEVIGQWITNLDKLTVLGHQKSTDNKGGKNSKQITSPL